MDKNSKIFVAGHSGLVGTSIIEKLRARGYGNIITKTKMELDLRRQEDTEKFFASEKPEYVFLAAGKVGGIVANSTYKAEFIYDNILIATNVVHGAYLNGVRKLLNLGSSCIYPRQAAQPIKESELLTGALEPTNEPYAVAKIAGIKICRFYNEQYGTNFISVMPTNLIGPRDNFNLETAHVPAALLRKFHLAKLLYLNDFAGIERDVKHCSLGFNLDEEICLGDRRSITEILMRVGVTRDSVRIWGSGSPLREFLYVDDLSEACIFLMERYSYEDLGELINVGFGRDMSIRDLSSLIRDIVGFPGDISFDSSRPDGMERKLLDTTKINALGWEPVVNLREAMSRTYQWYRETLI